MSLVTIQDASKWATKHLSRTVSPTNISYLVQYGKVRKYGENGSTLIDLRDLEKYYTSWHHTREVNWKQKLGNDLNWALSFDHLREKDTTKHVHRLHPYKGKFIPQLVEYFIDDHVDEFKTTTYFTQGDIILDPFSGSGTTLVQANEMGIHAIGIDVSHFNCMISNAKLHAYDLHSLTEELHQVARAITNYEHSSAIAAFEKELMNALSAFNAKHFPSPAFRYDVQQKKIDEHTYAKEKEQEFLNTYQRLVQKHNIVLTQESTEHFLDKWYCKSVREEIDFAFELIKKIPDTGNKKALAMILSRTIRSCRATTHSDLATLKEPQLTTYYCWKHKKICKPLYSIKYWFDRYATDTLARLREYERIRSNAHTTVLPADSRIVNIMSETKKRNPSLYTLLNTQKIRGIFTSPPYVGQIDYHEQHAYAYDLFGFPRNDQLEIGPLYKGQGKQARDSYVEGIADVLNNCKQYLQDDYDIFLVANDKHNLYPDIAKKSGMKIVNQFKRPVLNRTERDRNPYSEIIFHFKSL
jgi:hypothetical protein